MGMYSTPIQDVIDRLTYHSTTAIPARRLDGFKFEAVNRTAVEGMADLPGIKMFIPTIEARFRSSRQEEGTITIQMAVGGKRDDGISALIVLVEKVIDALNYDATNAYAPAIRGTMRPFDWKIENTFPLDLSINAQVSISLEPRPVALGNRH